MHNQNIYLKIVWGISVKFDAYPHMKTQNACFCYAVEKSDQPFSLFTFSSFQLSMFSAKCVKYSLSHQQSSANPITSHLLFAIKSTRVAFLLFYLKCCSWKKILSIHSRWHYECEYQIRRVLNKQQSKHTRNIVQWLIVLYYFRFLWTRHFSIQAHTYYCGKPLTFCVL